jgi:hypothetical protein
MDIGDALEMGDAGPAADPFLCTPIAGNSRLVNREFSFTDAPLHSWRSATVND